ncbi:hypothetical protein BRPE67_CCDS11960 [Caballeronia cordobensis]|nr:hypothetical protein BRPE67_CCDS11960 [Burkholderia sp. RPE67]
MAHEVEQDFFPGFASLDVEAGDVSFRGTGGHLLPEDAPNEVLTSLEHFLAHWHRSRYCDPSVLTRRVRRHPQNRPEPDVNRAERRILRLTR